MNRCMRTRDRVVNQLKAIQKFCETIDDDTKLEAIQVREESCEKLYKDYNDYEVELLAFDEYVSSSQDIDTLYLNTVATLKAAINTRSANSNTEIHDLNATLGQFIDQQQSVLHGINQTQTVQLPKINIEPFSGDYKVWPSFHDLYLTAVHEKRNITAVHKLQILNGLLRGEAAALIRHIKVTDQNYEEAWDKLVTRYNKPKSIICSMIQLFLEQKSCHYANHRELRKLCDTSDEVIRGLRAIGNTAEARDPWLIHLLVSKVDSDTRQLWAKESVDDEFPTFTRFLKFLGSRCDALESCAPVTRPTGTKPKTLRSFNTTHSTNWNCIACKQEHSLYKCPLFKSMNVENRFKVIENAKRCTNCLRVGHLQSQCFSRSVCLICKMRHHSLLHNNQQSTSLHATTKDFTSFNNNITASTDPEPIIQQAHQSTSFNQQPLQSTSLPTATNETQTFHEVQAPLNTILPTALLYIQASNGQFMLARALLDSGSQSSFISESCIQRLGLQRKYSRIPIYGLATSSAGKTRGTTTITIKSRIIPHYTILLTAHIIEKISSPLPSTKICIAENSEIWRHALADPQFNTPGAVDVLLGAEFFLDILDEKKIKIHNLPVLHASKFGWVIAGNIDPEEGGRSVQNFNVNLPEANFSNENLMDLLKRFWQVEELVHTAVSNKENDPCEILYRNTTTRASDGRFIVKLPFLEPRPLLGNSLATAKTRMFGVEKRFARDAGFHRDYKSFMQEYIQLNQMEQVPWITLPTENKNKYFMPHHAIFKESTTTKMRVVFDASSKTTTAVSLNDCLHTGPKLQPDLTTTLLRFRQNAIAINADIEKMYRQILVDPTDANFQCVLWRNDPQEELSPYKCKTVTYGTACAPFLAIRTLEETTMKYENKYPNAVKVIRNNFYMDDLLSGSDTVENAITLKAQIMEILSSGGFKLRKWKSNSIEFLKSLAVENTEDNPKLIEDDPSTKTLGIMWYPLKDIFTFQIKSQIKDIIWTKRKMLSESSKLYDPLGWLSPVVICFKIILQKLWLTKTDWDEEPPEKIVCLWNKTYTHLNYLQQIQIPRVILQSTSATSLQLHAFCDASEAAYGCVIYIRSSNDYGETTCRIACSKSKVAPIKQVSLPRLELCGAVLLAALVKYCQPIFNIQDENIYAWTDSTVVLHWLSDVPVKWKTFIANRTSTILEQIPRRNWNHVSSSQNPADYISRGVDPKTIIELKHWWQGPSWLLLNSDHWPKTQTCQSHIDVDTEERKTGVIVLIETVENNFIIQLLQKYSSWFKIKKIVAYVLRFCRLVGAKTKENHKGKLVYSEYTDAENLILRTVQGMHFKPELDKLKKKLNLEPSNILSSLDPFIDTHGLLRVGGRLRNSNLNYSIKHPIILPKNHELNNLIFQEAHTANLHAGVTLMMNIIRQKYWIIGARYQIKRNIKSCVTCIRYRRSHISQKMADLPPERCTKNRPFANVGIDYLGPIYIKTTQHRNSPLAKAYVAVFVCLAVKAVHLEVVSSLNTEAFLSALRRFVSRRGLPNQIWCDNGSNFIGANNELKKLKREIEIQQNKQIISDFYLQNNIQFRFNPASAPHFGGLWESTVKSIKYHFRRSMKEAKLNFEEATTLITQIEGILNSRPLCRTNNDSTSNELLTPGHFLIGESLLAIPEPSLEHIPLHKLSRLQNIQKRIQSFWHSWSTDYLTTLQQRRKGKSGTTAIDIDDVVLIKDDNLAPSQWIMGRIIETHPGADGIVRVATVKTTTTTIKRPVVKLIPLSI